MICVWLNLRPKDLSMRSKFGELMGDEEGGDDLVIL